MNKTFIAVLVFNIACFIAIYPLVNVINAQIKLLKESTLITSFILIVIVAFFTVLIVFSYRKRRELQAKDVDLSINKQGILGLSIAGIILISLRITVTIFSLSETVFLFCLVFFLIIIGSIGYLATRKKKAEFRQNQPNFGG